MIRLLWNSPTFTTWASFGARAAGLVFLLPLILTRLSAQEVVVFLLFNLLLGLRVFADFGFGPTFIRYIAYAMGGVQSWDDLAQGKVKAGTGTPNLPLLAEIVGTLRSLFRWMTLALLLAYGLGGSWVVAAQVRALAHPAEGWAAWAVLLPTLAFSFWATQFALYLQGLNRVALLRRWEALFNLLGILTVCGALLLGGSLLEVVASTQLWATLAGLRNWYLARQQRDRWWARHAPRQGTLPALRHLWGPAWRTGVGAGMSMGLVQLTGVVYAQMIQGQALAGLLLALRLMAMVVEFANAPFYSKLPLFSHFVSIGDRTSLQAAVRRGMQLAYAAFLGAWTGLGLLGPWALQTIGSKVAFPDPKLWALLGLAFLVHRFGAMHIQVCNVHNQVIMHIADGVSGVIYLAALLALTPFLHVLAMPAAQLVAYGGFYATYAASRSYSLLGTSFFRFERFAGMPALSIGVVCLALMVTMLG